MPGNVECGVTLKSPCTGVSTLKSFTPYRGTQRWHENVRTGVQSGGKAPQIIQLL